MYFDHHDMQRAQERHEQLLVEARILRLIRAAEQAQAAQVSQPRRRQSLLARVFALLRERPKARV
jgi:hypothetical protein